MTYPGLSGRGYQYLRVMPTAWWWGVRSEPSLGEEASDSTIGHEGIAHMTTIKFYAQRAMLFMGTLTAFAIVIDGAKRWS